MSAVAPKIDLAAWQEHFDFLLPRKELLRADEVAKALGCDERTILRHFDEGKLHGHDINAGTGQRQQIRYRRDSVILFLASRANYAPSDLRDRLLEVMAKQPVTDLVLLQQALGELIRRRR
jgi:hypothetical protein